MTNRSYDYFACLAAHIFVMLLFAWIFTVPMALGIKLIVWLFGGTVGFWKTFAVLEAFAILGGQTKFEDGVSFNPIVGSWT